MQHDLVIYIDSLLAVQSRNKTLDYSDKRNNESMIDIYEIPWYNSSKSPNILIFMSIDSVKENLLIRGKMQTGSLSS